MAAASALGFTTCGAQAQDVKVTQTGSNPRTFSLLVKGNDYQVEKHGHVVFQMIDGRTGQLLATNAASLNADCGFATDTCFASTTFTQLQIGTGRYCLYPATTLRFGTFSAVEQDSPTRWTTFVFPACL